MASLQLYDYGIGRSRRRAAEKRGPAAVNRRSEKGQGHPAVAAALLMVGVVAAIVLVSLLGALGR